MRRGTRVGQAYVAVTADGSGINEDIVDSLDEAGPDIDKAGEEGGERYGNKFSDRFRRKMDEVREKVADRLNKSLGDTGFEAGDTAGNKAGKSFSDSFEKNIDKDLGHRVGDKLGDSMGESLSESLERVLAQHRDDLTAMFDEQRAVSRNRGGTTTSRDTDFDFGRLFGKGSRNNFLNFFGRTIGNLTNLMIGLGKAGVSTFTGIIDGAKEAAKAFGEARAQGASFAKALTEVGAAGGKTLLENFNPAGLITIAVGLAAVALSASILVSVLSALTAIVTALAATITSALAGALLVGSAGFAAFAASIGLVTVAFMNMTNQQSKALKTAFKPLKTELRGIAQLMLKDMVPAFAVWSKNLQQALLLLAPVASVMGKAFATAGTIFTKALSGPGFQKFTQALTEELPSITVNLSNALSRFLNGLMATFGAILPLVTRFSVYLSNLATRFATWANSTKGQNAITDFVNRAVTALLSLWNFVREFSGFIFDVLFSPAAQNAGNSMFDSLAKSFAGFRRGLNDKKLEKWFKDASRFAGDLKVLLIGVVDVFQFLNSSGVLRALGQHLRNIGRLLSTVTRWLDRLGDASSDLNGTLRRGLLNALSQIISGFQWVINKVQEAIGWLRAFGDTHPNLGPINDALTSIVNWLDRVVQAAERALNAIQRVLNAKKFKWGGGVAGFGNVGAGPEFGDLGALGGQLGSTLGHEGGFGWSLPDLMNLGSGDFGDGGGGGGGGGGGNGAAKRIREAMRSLARAIRDGMKEIREATSAKDARTGIASLMDNIRDIARDAHRTVKQINKAMSILTKQKVLRDAVVDRLVRGGKIGHASLTELAAARGRVAAKLEAAKQKLQDAIALRDDFKNTVASSIRDFGSLMTAEAKTVDGVVQALTADDITSNLQTRLDKIRKFQDDLRLLIAQGLSNEAYKQLVEAGVEDGGAAAAALLQGGLASITQVNDLVGLIGGAADQLGLEASNRMYQAGVDAARGLVAGLTSLSAQLNSAATKLGTAIATALKNALGIHSPSRLMIDMMEDVGDGMAVGLGNQHAKVGAAAGRLAGQIAVSPEVAAYAGRQNAAAATEGETVSGNQSDQRFRDLIVQTPTEDPQAVAMEVLNEVTGRL